MPSIAPQMSDLTDGIQEVNGKQYLTDAKGNLVPIENVKPADKLEDEMVRKVMGYAEELHAQINRFRNHTMVDLGGFDAMLEQEYGVAKGGKKGNRTYQSFDGLMQVRVQVSEFIAFGAQLQTAKTLMDECMNEWAAESRPEIRALITRAFNTDKEGHVNRAELFMLMRLDITDERWVRAMEAVRDSIRITGSKEYVRFYRRETQTSRWEAVTIDLAKAGA
ncbi:MAG: DUF3164 family protein [Pseudomonadota bacterium]